MRRPHFFAGERFSKTASRTMIAAIVAASEAARNAWHAGKWDLPIRGDGSPTIAVREIPGIEFMYTEWGGMYIEQGFELYVLADVRVNANGTGLFFFAATGEKRALYAVTSNKVHETTISTPDGEVHFFEILDTDHDRRIPGKTPMRAINCDSFTVTGTGLDRVRVYAIEKVAPAARRAWHDEITRPR